MYLFKFKELILEKWRNTILKNCWRTHINTRPGNASTLMKSRGGVEIISNVHCTKVQGLYLSIITSNNNLIESLIYSNYYRNNNSIQLSNILTPLPNISSLQWHRRSAASVYFLSLCFWTWLSSVTRLATFQRARPDLLRAAGK